MRIIDVGGWFVFSFVSEEKTQCSRWMVNVQQMSFHSKAHRKWWWLVNSNPNEICVREKWLCPFWPFIENILKKKSEPKKNLIYNNYKLKEEMCHTCVQCLSMFEPKRFWNDFAFVGDLYPKRDRMQLRIDQIRNR